jgi:hypothetical protein
MGEGRVFDAPSAVKEVAVQAPRLPPSPVEAVFSIERLDHETLSAEPRLDEALTSDPGMGLYRRNSSLSSSPRTQGVSVRLRRERGGGPLKQNANLLYRRNRGADDLD